MQAQYNLALIDSLVRRKNLVRIVMGKAVLSASTPYSTAGQTQTNGRTGVRAVMIKALTTPSSIRSRVASFTATRATRCCRALCIGVLTGAFSVGRVCCAATATLAGKDCCKGQIMNMKHYQEEDCQYQSILTEGKLRLFNVCVCVCVRVPESSLSLLYIRH